MSLFISIVVISLNFVKAVTPTQNVLLIVIDDLRPALGCYGDSQAYTPNIDALSKQSIIFKKAFAQQALCAPSRNSFLTSRRPDTLHLYDFYSYWRDSVGNFTTLPQYFKDNNYHTMSIGKVFHPGVSSNFSDDQPYSWSESPYHPPTEVYKQAKVCIGDDGRLGRNLVCPVVPALQPGKTLPDIESLEEAKRFLQSRKDERKPFFLAVGFHKPHIPLKYPFKFLKYHPLANISLPGGRFHPFNLPTVAWNPWIDVRCRDDISRLDISFPFGRMPDNWTRSIIQSYYAAVTYVDDLIGKIVHELKKTNFYKNTVIALIGDHDGNNNAQNSEPLDSSKRPVRIIKPPGHFSHSWSLSEHGEWSKFSNFEVSVNVPFILRVPGLTTNNKKLWNEGVGFSTNELVELVDLFPTLVDVSGLKSLSTCPSTNQNISLCTEGTSLMPMIDQVITGRQNYVTWKSGAFSQYPRPGVFPTAQPNSDKPHLEEIKYMGYTIRTKNYRYTEWMKFKPFQPDWDNIVGAEMYSHIIDPSENQNLCDNPEMMSIRRRLSEQLRRGWRLNSPHMKQ